MQEALPYSEYYYVGFMDNKRFGKLVISIAIMYIIIQSYIATLYPGYSVVANAISDLGSNVHTAWIDTPFVIIFAIVLIAASLYSYRFTGNVVLAVLMTLVGVSVIGTGAFTESANIQLHGAFSIIAFASIDGSVLYFAFSSKDKKYAYSSYALGAIALLSTIVLMLHSEPNGTFGLFERMIVYPYIVWLAIFGFYIEKHAAGAASGADTGAKQPQNKM